MKFKYICISWNNCKASTPSTISLDYMIDNIFVELGKLAVYQTVDILIWTFSVQVQQTSTTCKVRVVSTVLCAGVFWVHILSSLENILYIIWHQNLLYLISLVISWYNQFLQLIYMREEEYVSNKTSTTDRYMLKNKYLLK